MDKIDTTIIGGGVVGLACAAMLSNKRNVMVIEKNSSVGQETSSRNSQVIHAGIYYPKDSLKGQLCRPGNNSLYEWADEHKVPYKMTGKYIVAQNEAEVEILIELGDRAWSNGVVTLEDMEGKDLPVTIKGIAALWSPRTGIIDVHKLMKSFVKVTEDNKGSIALRHSVYGVVKKKKGYVLKIFGPNDTSYEIFTKTVINAAGLHAHKIAKLVGCSYNVEYYKGSYWRIKGQLPTPLIYPVPNENSLGIHLISELDGSHRIGPDVEKVTKLDYKVNETASSQFYTAAKRYIKDLDPSHMWPDTSGIRPIVKGNNDFIINEDLPGWINLIGIASPGLTCCIEIARLCNYKLYKEFN